MISMIFMLLKLTQISFISRVSLWCEPHKIVLHATLVMCAIGSPALD